MTHPHSMVIVKPLTIAPDGVIKVFNLRFWSQESSQFSGRLIDLRIGAAPFMRAGVFSFSGERLCEVDLIDDGGFAAVDAAKSVARAAKAVRAEKATSVAELSIVELGQIINESIETNCQRILADRKSGIALSLGKIKRKLRAAINKRIHGHDVHLNEQAQRCDLVFENAQSILCTERHDVPPVDHADQSSAAPASSHHLSKWAE